MNGHPNKPNTVKTLAVRYLRHVGQVLFDKLTEVRTPANKIQHAQKGDLISRQESQGPSQKKPFSESIISEPQGFSGYDMILLRYLGITN